MACRIISSNFIEGKSFDKVESQIHLMQDLVSVVNNF